MHIGTGGAFEVIVPGRGAPPSNEKGKGGDRVMFFDSKFL
tara:strand:+ start:225 stop:344 length:120 start_codon:yes stop_codon:yes gene_type:complete